MVLLVLFTGCGEQSTTIEYIDKNVSDGEIVYLEVNETIAYPSGSDIQIINIATGAYYVTCNGSNDCIVHIGDETTQDITNVDYNLSTDNVYIK